MASRKSQYYNQWLYDQNHPEMRKQIRKRAYAKFRDWLISYKLDKGCVDCGYRGHHAALEFDHSLGKKRINIASCGNIANALRELVKCEVRCANCHNIRHHNSKHGNKGQ